MEDETAQVLVADRYLLGRRLGSGGMAQVFRAGDLVLGRPVAVKLFGPSVDPRGPDRIRDEMRTLAGLSHPGLVTVYDAGTDEPAGGAAPRAFLVMELIDGVTLGQRITTGPLPPDDARRLGAALAEALAYVHSRGVVHRDVKPANILLDPRGAPHLADFGIARTLGQSGHTQTGFTVGTAAYLSPEQVLGRDVGPPADIYALGLVLLEALTGRREYSGSTAEAALVRLSRPPQVDPQLPAPWPALLVAMTDLDPDRRPDAATTAAVLRGQQHLVPPAAGPGDEATAGLPRTALLPGGPPVGERTRVLLPDRPVRPAPPAARRPASPARSRAGARRRPARRGRRTLLGAAAGVALLAAVVAAALSGRGGGQAPTPPPPPAPTTPPGPAQLTTDLHRLHTLITG